VHVTPREQERLLIFTAAELARRRLARGACLGATEAIALVCDEVLEMAWDGVPIEEVVRRAQGVVAADQVLPGVANTVPSLQVEALFPTARPWCTCRSRSAPATRPGLAPSSRRAVTSSWRPDAHGTRWR
jgi:urease gamma subunit